VALLAIYFPSITGEFFTLCFLTVCLSVSNVVCTYT
jgi:hypothetical protein